MPDRIEQVSDDAENGLLADTGNVGTAAFDLIGTPTAQVRVVMPTESDDLDDDDVVGDELPYHDIEPDEPLPAMPDTVVSGTGPITRNAFGMPVTPAPSHDAIVDGSENATEYSSPVQASAESTAAASTEYGRPAHAGADNADQGEVVVAAPEPETGASISDGPDVVVAEAGDAAAGFEPAERIEQRDGTGDADIDTGDEDSTDRTVAARGADPFDVDVDPEPAHPTRQAESDSADAIDSIGAPDAPQFAESDAPGNPVSQTGGPGTDIDEPESEIAATESEAVRTDFGTPDEPVRATVDTAVDWEPQAERNAAPTSAPEQTDDPIEPGERAGDIDSSVSETSALDEAATAGSTRRGTREDGVDGGSDETITAQGGSIEGGLQGNDGDADAVGGEDVEALRGERDPDNPGHAASPHSEHVTDGSQGEHDEQDGQPRLTLDSGPLRRTLATTRSTAVDRTDITERTDITLTSKRLDEFESDRESADLLTADRLLDPHQTVRPEPEGAWQRFVYALTGHRVNLGDSRRVRNRKEMDRRIALPLTGGARFVPVLSRKGGVGKTTVTMLLGMALAAARDDRIIALDANPDRGTLADRIVRPSGKTVRDLARTRGSVGGFNDLSAIVARDETRLDVLASDADPHVSEAFNDADYHDVASLAAHYYSIVLTDTGTGVVDSVMRATLERADQLVIVSGMRVDEARLASETLTWLETNGHADRVRSAVVVLNSSRPGSPLVRRDELVTHFNTRVRTVVTLPYDPQVATGSAITFADIAPDTREAARELAASVVEGLSATQAG